MQQEKQKCPEYLRQLVLMINPLTAVDYAYAFFISLFLGQDEAERKSAERVVMHFNELCDAIPRLTREGMFMHSIMAAIDSLVRGLHTRRDTRKQMEDMAREAMSRSNLNILRVGLWRWFGLQALFATSMLVFGWSLGEMFLPGVSANKKIDTGTGPIATAVATMMAGFIFRSFWNYLRNSIMFWKFQKRMDRASQVYSSEAKVEYDRFVNSSCMAYALLTGSRFEDVMKEFVDNISLKVYLLTGERRPKPKANGSIRGMMARLGDALLDRGRAMSS